MKKYFFLLLILFCLLSTSQAQAESVLTQQIQINWQGKQTVDNKQQSFIIPGIGVGEIICNRQTTRITMFPTDISAETQMWSVKNQSFDGKTFDSSVHNARVYKYSHPLDTSLSGTGRQAHERFNQLNGGEDTAEGNMEGVISQRAGRNTNDQRNIPTTSFEVSWKWSNLNNKDQTNAKCFVKATLKTALGNYAKTGTKTVKLYPNRKNTKTKTFNKATLDYRSAGNINVSWHGEERLADGLMTNQVLLDGLGTLIATCPPKNSEGFPSLTFKSVSSDADIWLETFEGAGENIKSAASFIVDPTNNIVGPMPLPVNGQINGEIHVNKKTVFVTVSSYQKLNDLDPRMNMCEVAVSALEK